MCKLSPHLTLVLVCVRVSICQKSMVINKGQSDISLYALTRTINTTKMERHEFYIKIDGDRVREAMEKMKKNFM